MRHGVSKDLHDVYVIIDEVADLKFAADYRLLLPIEAEPQVVGIQTGAGEEVYRIQPRVRSGLHSWSGLGDDPHATLAD